MKKIYISGKISGLPFDQVCAKFERAEKYLKDYGWQVVSPLTNGLPIDSAWQEHMKADIRLMLDCDAIYLLDNWVQSRGARIEFSLACDLGLELYHQTGDGHLTIDNFKG